MSIQHPEHGSDPNPREKERSNFADKFKDLLPGIEFEEPIELVEARMAALEALVSSRDSGTLRSVWIEYASLCERIVDDKADANPYTRARSQITILVHKALIFRAAGDLQRYGEDLSDAEEYAYNMGFDEIAEVISVELNDLTD